jgi:hypothetical protein
VHQQPTHLSRDRVLHNTRCQEGARTVRVSIGTSCATALSSAEISMTCVLHDRREDTQEAAERV